MTKSFYEDLSLFCKAKYSVLWAQTSEEVRLMKMLNRIAKDLGRQLIVWSCTDGLREFKIDIDGVPIPGDAIGGTGTNDIKRMLAEIEKHPNPAIFVLKDPHKSLENTVVNRMFRDIYHALKGKKKTIVICSPVLDIPAEMMQEVTIIDFPLPDETELGQILDDAVEGLKEQADEGDEKAKEVLAVIQKQVDEGRDDIIRAGMGLGSETFENIISKCIAMHSIDVQVILQEKQQAIRKGGLLDFFPADDKMVEIGGLDTLKMWLDLREKTFGQEAIDYGLPAPKGLILLGIPGTGKSLTAKSIASRWHLPLIRLDVGSLFGSLVGQSEERTRKALEMAESISPAILWIDEIEKAFSFGGGDNGTSMRVFASILTWMQEKKKPCFVVATANNVYALPPELQRKGRFDEIFFIDLPNDKERKEIFEVHLRKHKYAPKDFDLNALVSASTDYVGAEIEQAVIDAMYIAFNDKKRKIKTADILVTLKKIVPQSRSMGEAISASREWLKEGRAISASAPIAEKSRRNVEV
jgi:hypothetical protein